MMGVPFSSPRSRAGSDSGLGTTPKVVVVYPEVFPQRCPCDPTRYVHVLWVLSPMGVQNKAQLDSGMLNSVWSCNDLVFNYAINHPGTAIPVTHSNLLQVLLNPSNDDEFRSWTYKPLARSGTVFMMRKARLFHTSGLTKLHRDGDRELTRRHSMADHIDAFRTHEYFVCYDPYSYYPWLAAMLGCIPIIHPLANTTKRAWLLKSSFAGYMERYSIDDAFGLAYGWGEAAYARRTLHRVRNQLWAVKEFGHSVTVPRFVRDVKLAANGQFDGFEGAILSHDLYPRGWWRKL